MKIIIINLALVFSIKVFSQNNILINFINTTNTVAAGSTIYTTTTAENTREIILKYFQIVAITEFGSQTFGKTGTTTVTLFLRRKEENPAPADHWKNRVDAWFAENEADAVYNDSNYIRNYCGQIEIDFTEFIENMLPVEQVMLVPVDYDFDKKEDNKNEDDDNDDYNYDDDSQAEDDDDDEL